MLPGAGGKRLGGVHGRAGGAAPSALVREHHQRGAVASAVPAETGMGQQPEAVEEPVLGVGQHGHGAIRVGLDGPAAGREQAEEPVVLDALLGHPVEEIRQAGHHEVRFQVAQDEGGVLQLAAGDAADLHMLLAEEPQAHEPHGLEGGDPLGRGLLRPLGQAHQALSVLREEGHDQAPLLEGGGAEDDGIEGADHAPPV